MIPAKRTLRIGLLWHSLRAGNLGVTALTLANMAIVREVAHSMGMEPDFTVLTMRERFTESLAPEVAEFEITARTMFTPGGFAAQIAALDCVIDIGAGDSFADIYGAKRYLYLWLSKFITLESSKPLILAPQTIGPFTRPIYTPLARHVLRRATAVVARDPASLDALHTLAPDADATLAVDVAFLLPFEDRSAERGSGPIRIGINASGLLCSQAESGQNRFGLSYDYLKLQRRLIRHWLDQGCEVHLLTHANSHDRPGDDDGTRADLLKREFPQAVRVPNFAGPSQAKSYISAMDFLVAGRMHACIGAFSSGTPVVPLAYSRKFAGLFTKLDYPWFTPMAGISDDEAFAFVIDAFEQRAQLAAAERAGMQQVNRLIDNYRRVLTREFTAISAGAA